MSVYMYTRVCAREDGMGAAACVKHAVVEVHRTGSWVQYRVANMPFTPFNTVHNNPRAHHDPNPFPLPPPPQSDADRENKNNAVLQLTLLTNEHRAASPAAIQDLFGMNIFRLLKEPLKIMISDLRSQQVCTCTCPCCVCCVLCAVCCVMGLHACETSLLTSPRISPPPSTHT